MQKKIANNYDLKFPFVPENLMDKIENVEDAWLREAVLDCLGVPKLFWNNNVTQIFIGKFSSSMATWKVDGCYIFFNRHRVVIRSPGRLDQVKSEFH